MKNYILTSLLFLCFTVTFSQKKSDIKEGWDTNGRFTFLFNQSAFSNWAAGGDNTLAGNIVINYEFNFKKDNFIWNNKLSASYGMTKSESVDFSKKTNDGINFTSLLGFDAKKNWYYSILFNFKTQFTKGYKYIKVDGVETRRDYTNFMSPGFLLIGPGMLWEKSKDFKFNLAPATMKFVFVDPTHTLPDKKYFGVDEGKSLRFELGFSASMFYKFKIMEDIFMENTLAFYSNYLDNPQNIDINYMVDIEMRINKYFTTEFLFQIIYDDNAYKGFQVRELFGVGIKYTFDK